MTQRMRSLKRQLNEAEELASRREAQFKYAQRELAEERESSAQLQKQLLDLQLHIKWVTAYSHIFLYDVHILWLHLTLRSSHISQQDESCPTVYHSVLILNMWFFFFCRRKESLMMRQTLDNYSLKLDLSDDEEEEEVKKPAESTSAENWDRERKLTGECIECM